MKLMASTDGFELMGSPNVIKLIGLPDVLEVMSLPDNLELMGFTRWPCGFETLLGIEEFTNIE